MIISIDHGNKNIKSKNSVFTTALMESGEFSPISKDTLVYQGKFYSLTNDRIPYMRDKTKDSRFFVLNLFAVAKELEALGVQDENIPDITLLIGLPPSHFGAQYKNFEKYFLNGGNDIEFEHNKRFRRINFNKVIAFPQAYAALYSEYGRIKDFSKVFVFDIGGYTLDYLLVNKGVADLSFCDSLDEGVITMYNRIISKMNSAHGLLLSESDIDDIINLYQYNQSSLKEKFGLNPSKITINPKIQEKVLEMVQRYTYELVDKFRERKIDLKSSMPVFVGGGSKLLRPFLENALNQRNSIFINNIRANVLGYEILYAATNAINGA